MHRFVLWSEALEKIRCFEVEKTPDAFVPRSFGRWRGIGINSVGTDREKLDDDYAVHVDELVVYVGYIDHGADGRNWIDAT